MYILRGEGYYGDPDPQGRLSLYLGGAAAPLSKVGGEEKLNESPHNYSCHDKLSMGGGPGSDSAAKVHCRVLVAVVVSPHVGLLCR